MIRERGTWFSSDAAFGNAAGPKKPGYAGADSDSILPWDRGQNA
jgi:hypothetical protein